MGVRSFYHQQIAAQCPEEGGPGVFISRSILNKLGVKTGYNDELLCYPPERMSNYLQHQTQKEQINIEIFPNPGTGLFYLRTNDIDLSESKVCVSELSGREIDFKILKKSKDSTAIDLMHSAPGVYLISIYEIATGNSVVNSRLILLSR